jgi:diguanylate cyclase (GGDEF)-like protein
MSVPFLRRLSTRLAVWVVLVAVLLGLIFGMLQVYLDYFNVKREFRERVQETIATVRKPAYQAAFQLDDLLADEVVQGLMNYKAVNQAILFDEENEILAADKKKPIDTQWRWVAEAFFTDRHHSVALRMRHEDGEYGKTYGTLEVYVDPQVIASGFLERASVTILSGLARNLMLAMIIFFLFQLLVNRPLAQMAKTMMQIDSESPEDAKLPLPKGHEEDELGLLVASTNDLLFSICEKVTERQQMLQKLADAATENARLLKLATIDGLTGLYIRRYFEVRYEEEFLRAQRYGEPLSIVLLDIDHFKSINDSYGHLQGDKVLQAVAILIQAAIRHDVDLAARYGGEEFILMLPKTDAQGAYALAERIRLNCQQQVFDVEGKVVHVTISIGIATLLTGKKILDKTRVVACADEMLYKAKQNGRNRVEVMDQCQFDNIQYSTLQTQQS